MEAAPTTILCFLSAIWNFDLKDPMALRDSLRFEVFGSGLDRQEDVLEEFGIGLFLMGFDRVILIKYS